MIAIVGRPPQRQFRQIARPDNYSVELIGDIHQYLRPLASLRVFVGDAAVAVGQTNIFKMLNASIFYANFFYTDSQCLHQIDGVVVGAPRRAKARHGNPDHLLARKAEFVHRPCRHQQSQSRVQAARNANYCSLRTRSNEALSQAIHLNIKYFAATFITIYGIVWDERHRIELAAYFVQNDSRIYVDCSEFWCVCVISERCGSPAQSHQFFYINISKNDLFVEIETL